MVCGTLDTKGEELRFIRDLLKGEGVEARLVDLSTSRKPRSEKRRVGEEGRSRWSPDP